MTEIRLRSDFPVDLIDWMGSDHRVVQAARTSTQGADAMAAGEGPGLTTALMRERHGVPFEHCVMSWLMRLPDFIWMEFDKHRAGVSISGESARYKAIEPEFYVAPPDRPLAQVPGSKRMAYEVQLGSEEQRQRELERDMRLFTLAYDLYEEALADGVLREKARTKLPVAIYKTRLVTMNLRAVMHFLSLRVRAEEPVSKFPSKPQWEINRVADLMEADMAEHFPVIHAAFVAHGRVKP